MKGNPLVRMREIYDGLSNAEKNIAKHLLNDPSLVMQYTIRELAAKLYVSPATIVRLSKTLGYDGYREFKQAVVYVLALYENNGKNHLSDISKEDSIKDIVEKVTYNNIQTLEETLNLMDMHVMEQCVEQLCSCRNVVLFGLGASLCVAKDASLKFLRVNKPCFVMEDVHSQYLLAQNATKEDFAIIFSYSGETKEMIQCAEQLKVNGTPFLAVTRYAESTLSGKADYVLYTSAKEELFRRGASSSRISQLNIVDILYSVYVSRNYEAALERFNMTAMDKEGKGQHEKGFVGDKE